MKALTSLTTTLSVLIATASGASASVPDPVGVWPLQPTHEVVHDFDPPDVPWDSGHRGVDLAGTVGQSVHSALDGTVAFAGKIAGKPVVTVSHGDTRTTYEPVVSTMTKGDVVTAGQRIGSLELAFSHCFPTACLHWGWLRAKTYLDPLDLVGDGRVRLLPLWRDRPVDLGGSSWHAPLLPYAAWAPLLRAHLPPDAVRPPTHRVQPPTASAEGVAVRRGGVPGGRPVAVGRW